MENFEKRDVKVSVYLGNPVLAKGASFCIQKDVIFTEYNNAIFPKENQNLSEYIDYLLSYFPTKMIENGYIKDCLEYLCA